jgi:hypothetical protein
MAKYYGASKFYFLKLELNGKWGGFFKESLYFISPHDFKSWVSFWMYLPVAYCKFKYYEWRG